jgi:hypothetical protein
LSFDFFGIFQKWKYVNSSEYPHLIFEFEFDFPITNNPITINSFLYKYHCPTIQDTTGGILFEIPLI